MTDFYTEIYIDEQREKVWHAFISHDSFFMAFYGANVYSTFKVGDRIEYKGLYEGEDTVHIYGNVINYRKLELLEYTDHPGPMYNEKHAELESRVRIRFSDHGICTRISVENDQFTEDNPMKEEASQWYLILSNFKTFVEKGELMKMKEDA